MPGTLRIRRAAAAVLVLAAVPLAGCGEDDPYAAYCETVADHRDELSSLIDEGGPAALFEALPTLRELRDAAPDDVRADWNTLIGAIEGLQQALEDAGVDPETYDRKRPPSGLDDADRAEVDEAAKRLANPATTRAALRLQQQVRDVCQEPLTL